MKTVWLIALNTYKEIIRDRILYGIVVFAILLIGLSLALGTLSFLEQARITADFGMVGVQLSSVILSIFVGSTLVSKEIEKRTIFTLLSHAVSRSQFLVAKLIGMLLVIFTVMTGLTLVLIGLFVYLEVGINEILFMALSGIFFEAAVLLAMTIFFGLFTSPLLAVSYTLGFFLIGHWLNDLKFFAEQSQSESFQTIGRIIHFILPNFENMNWKSSVTYGDTIPIETWAGAGIYSLAWVILFLCLSSLIFRRRDFV